MFREWVFTKVLPSIRKYGYYRMIDSRIKQRVIVDGKKFYKHNFFTNYAASKDGEVINLKTSKIMNKKREIIVIYNLQFTIKNLKNLLHTINIDLFMKFLKDQYHVVLKSTISIILKQITEYKTYNYLLLKKI